MKISIVDRHRVLGKEGRELAERRLLFALSRFDSKITRVALVMSDVDGSGGAGNSCRVVVTLHRLGEVSVEGQGETVESTVSHTVERAGRAVSRAVDRLRDRRRHAPA